MNAPKHVSRSRLLEIISGSDELMLNLLQIMAGLIELCQTLIWKVLLINFRDV